MLQAIAKMLLKLGGWTAVGGRPESPKAVVIAAPHTSNWDGFWGIVYKVSVRLEVRWFAKQSLFWFPLGKLLRSFGGLPLDRKRAGSAVDQAIEIFRTHDSVYFALAPEGTRTRLKHWKTGFYRIAEGAGVPVVLGFLDYGNKRIGLGPEISLSGDVQQDLDVLREFYSGVEGRCPEKAGPIEFPPKRQPRKKKGSEPFSGTDPDSGKGF